MPAAPVGAADFYLAYQGVTLNVGTMDGVLNNDSDADLDPLNAVLVTWPSHASGFTLSGDGSFSFTATTGYVGLDSFTYKPNDGTQDGNTTTVTIDVHQVISVGGTFYLGLEQQSLGGVIASFATNDNAATYTGFAAPFSGAMGPPLLEQSPPTALRMT